VAYFLVNRRMSEKEKAQRAMVPPVGRFNFEWLVASGLLLLVGWITLLSFRRRNEAEVCSLARCVGGLFLYGGWAHLRRWLCSLVSREPEDAP